MGREVKRMPLGFSWPLRKVWFGYTLPSVPCELCGGTGKVPGGGKAYGRYGYASELCAVCEGDRKAYPKVELPEWKPTPWQKEPPVGIGWQMWETTSEGSPISPVCETPEALARWLADHSASAFGRQTATYEQWLAMIRGGGHAPSMVVDGGRVMSGVEAMGGAGDPAATGTAAPNTE